MRRIVKVIIFSLIFILSGYFCLLTLFPSVYLNHLNYIEINSKDNEYSFSLINENVSSYVTLDHISKEFLNTLIYIEDQRFYKHEGIDISRIIASLIENIKANKIVQGGSTITQQLAKNAYLSNDKSYLRKVLEILYSKKIEDKYSKEEILEMYINNLYFSHNIYGLKNASEYYFNLDPSLLNYSQSALLVGIINAPNIYAPDIDLNASITKQQQILSTLYKNKIIDKITYQEALEYPLEFTYSKNENDDNLLYYYQGIKKQISELNISLNSYKKQGLKITSPFDINIYNKVNNIIKNHQKDSKNDEISVVVMKPYSGDVLTLIGGFDYSLSSYNRAIESKRQIGSTIKPFLYYLGLEKGMNPLSLFTSEETTFNIEGRGEYHVKNASGYYANRKINMVEALSLSDNIYAIKTTLLVGSSSINKLMKKYSLEIEDINPTIGLGSFSLTPLELTSLYNSLASVGRYYSPNFIKQVSLYDKTILGIRKSTSYQVLEKRNTLIINHLLKSPFDEALASYTYPSLLNYEPNITFGAKTGSTESTSWVVGFNPYYTIGVYVGNDDNMPLSSKNLAKKVFVDIANKLCENHLDKYYEVTSDMTPFTLFNSKTNKKSKVYYY